MRGNCAPISSAFSPESSKTVAETGRWIPFHCCFPQLAHGKPLYYLTTFPRLLYISLLAPFVALSQNIHLNSLSLSLYRSQLLQFAILVIRLIYVLFYLVTLGGSLNVCAFGGEFSLRNRGEFL